MSAQLQVSGEAKIRAIQGPVVANSGVITALNGGASQYVRGDGTLADFPTSTGGGSSVSYYLNSSVSQGTIGGVAYRQLGKTPISGAGTDIAISTTGYVASYLTDANDPSLLEVPAGNFNCEFYFSVNNNTGNPFVYAEVYKYDGTTFTSIGTSVGVPEYINQGTVINPYYFAVPVATSVLTVTDRIAIRIYVNVDGRTVTLHTENNHLCQVVTTFSKGLISLNNLTRQNQFFGTGTSGTDFGISSSVATHTFNLPVASAANTGKLSSTDWSTFNNKVPYTGATGSVNLGSYALTSSGVFANSLNATGISTQGGYLYLKQGVAPYIGFIGSNGISADGTKYLLIANVDASNNKLALFDLGSLTNNTARTFTLPDASGTLALTSNLSAYLPLTGGTLTGALGGTSATFSDILTAGNININPSSGEAQLNLKNTSTGNTIYNGMSSIFGVGGGALGFGLSIGTSTYKSFTFNFAPLTNNTTRIFTFPDASGTLALTSDLSGYVTLATTQTISGAKTFTALATNNEAVGIKLTSGVVSTGGYLTLNAKVVGTLHSLFLAPDSATNRAEFTFDNSAIRTYALQNASGTIALLSGTQTFTGATTFSSNITVNSVQVGSAGNTTNIKFGDSTFGAITTGSNNIAIGSSALTSLTTSNANIGIGNSALASVVDGALNTGIGFGIGSSITSGSNNALFGYGAGSAITTGNYNTILGAYAGTANMLNNIVLADGAGNVRYQWNGTNNVFGNPISGTSATFSMPSGNGALTIANSSLSGKNWTFLPNTNGAESDLLLYYAGASAGTRLTIASSGAATFSSSVTANNNLSVIRVGSSVTTLGQSRYLDLSDYYGNTNARMEIGLGYSAATGVTNIPAIIGYLQTSTTGYTLGDIYFATRSVTTDTAPSERMRITSGGNVGIGTSNPNVSGQDANKTILTVQGVGGQWGGVEIGGTGNTGAGALNGFLGFTNASLSAGYNLISYIGSWLDGGGVTSGADMRFHTQSNGTAGPNERMRITSGGNVGIGISTPTYKLVVGAADANCLAILNNSIGGGNPSGITAIYLGDSGSGINTFTREKIANNQSRTVIYSEQGYFTQQMGAFFQAGIAYQGNNSATWSLVSDIRIKENIRPISDSLNKILALKPCHFEYKTNLGKTKTGFIAQEFEQVLPGHVTESPVSKEHKEFIPEEDGTIKSIDTDLIPYLVKAIQEQQAQIEELKQLIKNK